MKKIGSLVPQALADAGHKALQTHAGSLNGLEFALLATPDGFEIASLRDRSELPAGRLSAMASSLMAMARAVGREIRSPDCKRLTFEAQGSTVVFQSIDSPQACILCLVLGPEAVLGRALWAAGGVTQDLSQV
jgi:predicted regulator of Ras-like GTPase activity (Roadblock/LC7/MglB family)